MGSAVSIKCFQTLKYVHLTIWIDLQFAPQLGHQVFAFAVAQKVSEIGECTNFHAAL